jgi:opacity protein-like surface antigen
MPNNVHKEKYMKKALLVALALIASVAQAEDKPAKNFIQLQYAYRDTIASDKADPNRQGVNFTFGTKVLENLTWDVSNQFRSENGQNSSDATRLETGLSYQYGVAKDVALYTRGAVGYKYTNGADSSYYSIEPGVKVQLTSPLAVKVGYRFRDSFSDSYFDQTNTLRLGAEYTLSENTMVTAGLDRSWKDSEFVGANAGYVVKF